MLKDSEHIYIKAVSVRREQFDKLNDSICLRYMKLKEKNKISFSMFQRGILLAFVLGNLTAHGDKEAIDLFFSCLSLSYIPSVKMFKDKDKIKMYVCVSMKKLHAENKE